MKSTDRLHHLTWTAVLFALLAGCGGGNSSSTATTTDNPPTVDAGADQAATSGASVTLSATITDEGSPTIAWAQTAGTSVTLSSTTTASTDFTAPTVTVLETLTFEVSADDGVNTPVSDSVSVTVNPVTVSTLPNWIINTTERSNEIFESAISSLGVLEDVQIAEEQTVNAIDYIYVEATGIPNYDIEITQDIIDELNGRPRLANDFSGAATTAIIGQTVVFGEDIGYNSSNTNCTTTGGDGYWPPGPVCPTDQSKAEYLAANPTPTATECETGLGTTGILVNGTSIFNWGDGQSFGNNIWYNLAPVAEQYDVDICGGHAAGGNYHHHFYTSCLADLVGDDGSDHSPIYGFAADGYALYGPYESSGVLAVSGWATRDYGAATTAGGCGTTGERTCTLVDQYDLAQGVDASVTQGPDIGATVTTLSGNSLAADDGYYFEDYFYAGVTATGAQLDQHNGHDNGDGHGYHYHITLVDDGTGSLAPSFPYTVGPRFYGELPGNALTSCGGGGGGPPP